MSKLAPPRRYRGIPEPGETIDELLSAVSAMQEVIEVLTRQRGAVVDSVVTVEDLVYLGLIDRSEVRGVKGYDSGKVA